MKHRYTFWGMIFCKWLNLHWPGKQSWVFEGRIHATCRLCGEVVNRPLRANLYTWLWRRNDFLRKSVAKHMQESIDKMPRRVFLGGDSTSTSSTNASLSMKDIEDAIRKVEEIDKKYNRDQVSKIVITILTTPGSVLKCRYKDKLYLLISRADWPRVKGFTEVRQDSLPYSPYGLNGIPVVEDDDLAREILIGALMPLYLARASQYKNN